MRIKKADRLNRLKKNNSFCHSDRSVDSLFGLNAGKERFLGTQRASEWRKFKFFRSL